MPSTQTIVVALAWLTLGACAYLAYSGISSMMAGGTARRPAQSPCRPVGKAVPAEGDAAAAAAPAGHCLIDLSAAEGEVIAPAPPVRPRRKRSANSEAPGERERPDERPGSPGDLILSVHMPPSGFTDAGHLQNFLGYMASRSSRHGGGPRTAWNMVEIGANRGFNTDRTAMRAELIARFGECDPAITVNDIVYLGFLVEVEGRLWSNLCATIDDVTEILAVREDASLAKEIFGIAEDIFQDHVSAMTSGGSPVHAWEDCDAKTRVLIENRLRDELNARYPADVLVSVSHNDQEQIMHVHRLLALS